MSLGCANAYQATLTAAQLKSQLAFIWRAWKIAHIVVATAKKLRHTPGIQNTYVTKVFMLINWFILIFPRTAITLFDIRHFFFQGLAEVSENSFTFNLSWNLLCRRELWKYNHIFLFCLTEILLNKVSDGDKDSPSDVDTIEDN